MSTIVHRRTDRARDLAETWDLFGCCRMRCPTLVFITFEGLQEAASPEHKNGLTLDRGCSVDRRNGSARRTEHKRGVLKISQRYCTLILFVHQGIKLPCDVRDCRKVIPSQDRRDPGYFQRIECDGGRVLGADEELNCGAPRGRWCIGKECRLMWPGSPMSATGKKALWMTHCHPKAVQKVTGNRHVASWCPPSGFPTSSLNGRLQHAAGLFGPHVPHVANPDGGSGCR